MNWEEGIKKYDSKDMYHKIIHMPEHIYKIYNEYFTINLDKGQKYKDKIKKIIICGMGGSAISGDIFKDAFTGLLQVHVIKDYNVGVITPETLFIAVSYSGNTEETLSALSQAMEFTDMIAAVTSGGKLKEIVKNDYPFINLEKGMPPRSAIGYLFFALLKLADNLAIIDPQKEIVNATIANLMQKAGAIAESVEEDFNIAKQSAIILQKKVPLIYASEPTLSALAYRWKCQFNENSKNHAFFHTFSEMNHNEIEGWENDDFDSVFVPIFLNRLSSSEKYRNRIDIFKKLLNDKEIEYLDFYTEGKSLIEEVFSLVYLGDMVSYYLGILNKVDPTAINYINYLKNKL